MADLVKDTWRKLVVAREEPGYGGAKVLALGFPKISENNKWFCKRLDEELDNRRLEFHGLLCEKRHDFLRFPNELARANHVTKKTLSGLFIVWYARNRTRQRPAVAKVQT